MSNLLLTTTVLIVSFFAIGIIITVGRTVCDTRHHRSILRRTSLSDEEFFDHYYSTSLLRRAVVLRLRRVFVSYLGADPIAYRFIPDDDITTIFGDVDTSDVVRSIEAEFHVTFLDNEVERMSTFDAVLRTVSEKVQGEG